MRIKSFMYSCGKLVNANPASFGAGLILRSWWLQNPGWFYLQDISEWTMKNFQGVPTFFPRQVQDAVSNSAFLFSMMQIVMRGRLDQILFMIFGHSDILQSLLHIQTEISIIFILGSPSCKEVPFCAFRFGCHSNQSFRHKLKDVVI